MKNGVKALHTALVRDEGIKPLRLRRKRTGIIPYFRILMSFRYPKNERLKSQKTIERLFRDGQAVNRPPLRLVYLKLDSTAAVKIEAGVTVSSKVFRKAVDRNRVKRLLREAYRLNKSLVFNNLQGHFAFLFLYIGKEMPTFIEIDAAMKALLKKLIARTNNEEVSK